MTLRSFELQLKQNWLFQCYLFNEPQLRTKRQSIFAFSHNTWFCSNMQEPFKLLKHFKSLKINNLSEALKIFKK